MTRTSLRLRGALLARAGLAAALALGGATGAVMMAAPAMAASAPQPKYSPAFVALAGPFQKELADAKGKAGDKAATDALKAKLDPIIKAATTPDDKLAAGNFAVSVGGMAQDTSLQGQGIKLMIDSGKAPADQLPKLHFYLGEFAFQDKNYAEAKTELKAAIDAGYTENDVQVMLAEVYLNDNQTAEGLATLQKAIDTNKGKGVAVPESWYRRGLGAAYAAKDVNQSTVFGAQLAQAYPSKQNWAAAIDVLRDLAHYPSQDELDLMRLMSVTDSWAEERDYLEYIQAADARRSPGEVKAVIDHGVASGMLKADNQFVSEAAKIATGRIAGDKASLPGLDKDARAGSATATTVAGAGDAFLSYSEGAKAADLYKIALGKPGVDANVVNTRLGIALIYAGDFAGAQAAFAKVEGPRKPLAQLWSVYAQQKAASH